MIGGKDQKCKIIIRKFLCLSDKDQSETPDAEEQRELLIAGLGEARNQHSFTSFPYLTLQNLLRVEICLSMPMNI